MNKYTHEDMIRITNPLPNTPEMRQRCESMRDHIKEDPARYAEVRTFQRKQKLQVWANIPKDYQQYGKNMFKKKVV